MSKEDLEDCRPLSVCTTSHVEFRDRVRKTLYYGQYSDGSLPSLAVTDVAVEVLSSVVPTKRKCLDTNYAMVVSRRAKISPCSLMMGILYSERLQKKNPEYLNRVTSSDLFLISMMVASKYLYDEGEDEEVFNDDWAKAGSKTVNDVNKLEMEFLASISGDITWTLPWLVHLWRPMHATGECRFSSYFEYFQARSTEAIQPKEGEPVILVGNLILEHAVSRELRRWNGFGRLRRGLRVEFVLGVVPDLNRQPPMRPHPSKVRPSAARALFNHRNGVQVLSASGNAPTRQRRSFWVCKKSGRASERIPAVNANEDSFTRTGVNSATR